MTADTPRPPVAPTSIVVADHLSKWYGQVIGLNDVSVAVPPGITGLLGPNGSGKSTTLKIILGLVSLTRWRTEIFGRDSNLVESREAVGFLPENPYFYKYLTGAEALRFFGRLCGLGGARLKNRVAELLEQVGLTNARDQRLGTYSKGMLQRIGLAQALINEPKLVVLDEPTAGVDPAGSRDIRNLIVDLKRCGTTVLLSSHLLAQVQEICDRIGILAKGVLVREGRLEELIAIENQTEFVVANAPAAAQSGGLSGAPLHPLSVRVIAQLRADLGAGFPIIGIGGIVSADHARATLRAGANLIQIYTGFAYRGPMLLEEILQAVSA